MDARKVLPDRTTYVLSIRILLACKGFSCNKTQHLNREYADLYESITSPYHQPRATRGSFLKVRELKREEREISSEDQSSDHLWHLRVCRIF